MQKTLFFYIFRDLLKVFLLASGAIAGIMSFGGLLRPLTQHGLDLAQVGQMLGYFMPAMTNYSWLVAALFATTFVYGRLSADNELTACRAAGLPYWKILMPAFLLGLVISILSVGFLCFVVPHSFLKAEKVVYSNLAQLVASQIQRTQRVNLNANATSITIFARDAEVLKPSASNPSDQAVELRDVAIVSYLKERAKNAPRIPKEFYLADSATAVITMPKDGDGDVMLSTYMVNGGRVPRPSEGQSQDLVRMSVAANEAGPFALQSPVRETAKFMDITRLLDLRAHPEKSRRILKHISELARADQIRAFERQVQDTLAKGTPLVLSGHDGNVPVNFTVTPSGRQKVSIIDDGVSVVHGTVEQPGIEFRADRADTPFTGKARQIVVSSHPDTARGLIYAKVEVRDAVLWYDEAASPLQSRLWNIAVPMSKPITDLSTRSARQYLEQNGDRGRVKGLHADLVKQQNQIESELHSRFSFALSCFVLALVGATIGMMFKSGNFVSAFAISVGPALVAIVLIVTGQHIAESVPKEIGPKFQDPLSFGLSVLWSGNAIVVAMGLALYAKISRT